MDLNHAPPPMEDDPVEEEEAGAGEDEEEAAEEAAEEEAAGGEEGEAGDLQQGERRAGRVAKDPKIDAPEEVSKLRQWLRVCCLWRGTSPPPYIRAHCL